MLGFLEKSLSWEQNLREVSDERKDGSLSRSHLLAAQSF